MDEIPEELINIIKEIVAYEKTYDTCDYMEELQLEYPCCIEETDESKSNDNTSSIIHISL